jgi:hypothetical protein
MCLGVKHYQGATLNPDNVVNSGSAHGARLPDQYFTANFITLFPLIKD